MKSWTSPKFSQPTLCPFTQETFIPTKPCLWLGQCHANRSSCVCKYWLPWITHSWQSLQNSYSLCWCSKSPTCLTIHKELKEGWIWGVKLARSQWCFVFFTEMHFFVIVFHCMLCSGKHRVFKRIMDIVSFNTNYEYSMWPIMIIVILVYQLHTQIQ